MQAQGDLSAPGARPPQVQAAELRAGAGLGGGARGRRYSRWAAALLCWGIGVAGGGRDPDGRAAGTREARSEASAMSRKCDVVVVGGGISGQSRRRPSFLPRPDRWPPGGRGVARGWLMAEGLGPWGGGWSRTLTPRLSMPWRAFRGSRAPRTILPRRRDMVRSQTEAGAESLWKGWGQALNFSLRRLPGLRLGEF